MNDPKQIAENFVQLYRELVHREPHISVHVWLSDNSDYCDQIDRCKNCYLVFNSLQSEDCMYMYDSRWSKNCSDISYCNHSELCYDSLDLEKCYNCDHCQDCTNSNDCQYSYDLRNCNNCLGCAGLRHKNYHIFNKPYSKKEYEELTKKLLKNPGKIEKQLEKLCLEIPHVALHTQNTENCFGNYVVNSKNSYCIFKTHNLEDCMYMHDTQREKDCMDCFVGNESELAYGCTENSKIYNCNFSYWCANNIDCEYMMYSFSCKNCFGCFNLKHKEYRILNKQYTKEEYEKLLPEIKKSLREKGQYMNFLPDVM
ncbi:hypothetical protein HOF67_01285 [Candidatus Peregrinibacteria bacterium]|jgi:hypothetical protein|nr:hypothetical protein [Candidatus Peregrinibacteria bacterium]